MARTHPKAVSQGRVLSIRGTLKALALETAMLIVASLMCLLAIPGVPLGIVAIATLTPCLFRITRDDRRFSRSSRLAMLSFVAWLFLSVYAAWAYERFDPPLPAAAALLGLCYFLEWKLEAPTLQRWRVVESVLLASGIGSFIFALSVRSRVLTDLIDLREQLGGQLGLGSPVKLELADLRFHFPSIGFSGRSSVCDATLLEPDGTSLMKLADFGGVTGEFKFRLRRAPAGQTSDRYFRTAVFTLRSGERFQVVVLERKMDRDWIEMSCSVAPQRTKPQ